MTVVELKTIRLARGSRSEPSPEPIRRDWTSLNWVFALLVTFGSALATMAALAPVMNTVGCSAGAAACSAVGQHQLLFDVLYYGAPAVGVVTLLASFFTAAARRGIIVPLCASFLLLADIVAVVIMFGG